MKKRIRAFGYAINGILLSCQNAFHFRIHLSAAFIVIIMGFYFRLEIWEWCVIFLCIGGVLALESVNTSLEIFCDTIHPEENSGIKVVKDIAAGAVLLFSLAALICGVFIFSHYF